jgi:hypothetical protein
MKEEWKAAEEAKAKSGQEWSGPIQTRQSAVGVIEDRIMGLRKQADDLERLLGILPRQLTREQDEALWSIFINSRI